jgi:hypothetical protein
MRVIFPSVCLLAAMTAPLSCGYSVLSHEAIVDSLWKPSIQAMLLKRFPASTPEEMEKAHAFAYGGCILQDMGYYPFSSHLFSDLTHYVRSGDFIAALIRESQDIDEYAFALGALAHYAADISGHRLATNLAVPILYPKLRAKFGKEVTYGDDPVSHLRTDFAFDVLQVAHGRYAPDGYKAFIGFEVSKPVLERAFADTYGLELKDVFGNLDLALGSFRYSVSSIIPGMTRVAWQLKKDQVTKEIPGMTKKKFLYNLSRSNYEKEWGTAYHKPGFRTELVAWVIRVIPKIGPFKSLAFRAPTPQVEKMFMDSFNATVDAYRALLANVDAAQPEVRNENLDLGEPAPAGKYMIADKTYDELLAKLADHKFVRLTPGLRNDILEYYKNRTPPASPSTKKESDEWAKVAAHLEQLKQSPAEPAGQP